MGLDKGLLENFQKHERLEVEFSPGITCVVGKSDQGKSSLLRALRWACLNRPRGNLVRRGEKVCKVRLKIDGVVLRRERDGNQNLYQLGSKKFSAFRDEVPVEIQEFLRLGDFNFQLQHDPQFWFSLSPPELSRQLNKLVDLDLIDLVVDRLESRKRRLKAEEELVEGRLKDAQARVQETSGVVDLDRSLSALERMEKDIVSLQDSLQRLRGILSEIKGVRNKLALCGDILRKGEGLVSFGSKIREGESRRQAIEGLVTSIRTLRDKACRRVPDISRLDSIVDRWKELASRGDKLREVVDGIRGAMGELKRLEEGLLEAKAKLMEETKGRCPICGGVLKS